MIWFKYGLGYDQCERLRGGWRKGKVAINKSKQKDGWRLQINHPRSGKHKAVTILAEFKQEKYITAQLPQAGDADGTWALAAH